MYDLNSNTDPNEMKPGPHIDPEGKHHPPVGTFNEMIQRAKGLEPPRPFDDEFKIRLLITIYDDPDFREALRDAIRE